MQEPAPGAEERQLALLVAGAIDYAIFMLDTTGHVLTWNAGAERMKGYTRAQIVGRHFSIFYTSRDVARDHPAHELEVAERDGHYEEEGWRVRRDGSIFWAGVVITALRDEQGRLLGFGKVSRDLTANRLAEEQLRSRAARLEAANRELSELARLVSGIRDYAIFMLDPTGRVLTWNAGARHLKGYAADEAIGRHFSIFYTAPDVERDHPAHELEIAERDGRYEEEGWRVRRDGSTFWASVTITAIRDDDGRLTGFAKVTRDLSERKAADDALRAAVEELRRTNAELDRFSGVAAHDMSDPLRTISGFAEILEREDLTDEERREFAGHIRSSSVRLSEMLESLLQYARAGRDDESPVAVGLRAVTDRVLADLTAAIEARGARVTVTVPTQAAVLAHVRDVEVVLQNLVSNAVKFGDARRPEVRVDAAPSDDGGWRVLVADNGLGVAEADRVRIFDAFGRAATPGDRAGYGLGLAICARVVARHGGAIGLEEGPAEGGRFWFTLPAATRDGS